MLAELVPFLYTCRRNWYRFFTHVREIGTDSWHPIKAGHRCDEYTLEVIIIRNLSTNGRLQNLLKSTKFHIWKVLSIGTISSYRLEIYEKRNLRFNKDSLNPLTLLNRIINDKQGTHHTHFIMFNNLPWRFQKIRHKIFWQPTSIMMPFETSNKNINSVNQRTSVSTDLFDGVFLTLRSSKLYLMT